jgi:transposase
LPGEYRLVGAIASARPQIALVKKRHKKSSKATRVDVAALHERLVELEKVNLDEEQDPAVLRAYVAELRRNQAALQEHSRTVQAELHEQQRAFRAEHAALKTQTEALQAERDKLAKQLAYLNRLVWGRRSEKLTREELGQLVLAFGGSAEQASADAPDVPVPPALEDEVDADDVVEPKKRRHPGRTKLSPSLERIVGEPVRVPHTERACQHCSNEMAPIGFVEHERVEYVPAKFVVHVERREKLACKVCRGDAVTAERVMPASTRRVGASVLAHLVESKCDDALPIHRQQDQFARLGFEVPSNTLYSYWAYVTDLLQPVADTTLSVVLGDPVYVAMDDTTLKVLDKNKGSGTSRGHLWCFAGAGPLVGYAFTETWAAAEVAPWIRAIDAAIQCDDYKGYGAQVSTSDGQQYGPLVDPERRLGCMMHVRRRFHEALKLGDKRAAEAIELIQGLYAVEALAKERALAADNRLELRNARALPLLANFEAAVDTLLGSTTPGSPLGAAARYAAQQRPFLRRCFTDGRFEIDNGRVERLIREPALGRKNFLFTGSTDGAKRLAAAYSLVQSCRNLGFGARDYLIDVIGKLEAGWPLRRIVELVPDRWALERGLLSQPQQASQ